jgi:hypothetical protein
VPTPVGPVAPDPNDPDFWDWSDPDEGPIGRRHPLMGIIAIVLVAALLLLVLVNVF